METHHITVDMTGGQEPPTDIDQASFDKFTEVASYLFSTAQKVEEAITGNKVTPYYVTASYTLANGLGVQLQLKSQTWSDY